MRVKRLDLFGFKSFATRQSIAFGEGVTGVVGPNGCGKSNVVDALRWVMGEQNARHLRGGNMQDIIFCGSEKKAPLGFAEVILTIDNQDKDAPLDYNHYSEIQITRRLYRNGDSEYEINKQKARLKDISEFFLGTGVGTKAYSIIEQGRVNEVISAKPPDRRALIEEAAGITKYKAKKALAERRMDATRLNLDRIVGIRNEVDQRVNILAREKEKLEQAQLLKSELRNLDIHMASHQYLALAVKLNYLKQENNIIQNYISNLKQDLACKEQAFSHVLNNYAHKHDQKRLLEELLLQHSSSRELLKKDLEYAQATIQENAHFIARVQNQLEELEKREHELKQDVSSYEKLHEETNLELKNLVTSLDQQKQSGHHVIARRQNSIVRERDIQAQLAQAAALAARLQAEINATRDKETHKKSELVSLGQEIYHQNHELSTLKERLLAINLQLQLGLERRDNLAKNITIYDNEILVLQTKLAHHNKIYNLDHDEERKLAARLSSLQEIDQGLEWSESGIVALLNSPHREIIHGVIADTLEVSVGHEALVEKCLAHLLDTALIKQQSDLTNLASWLKEQKAPHTSFLVLDQSPLIINKIGLPDNLIKLTKYIKAKEDKFNIIISYLENYILAPDIHQALAYWSTAREHNLHVVTPAGELLMADGRALIVGSSVSSGVLQRKAEKNILETKLEELKLKLIEQQENIEEIKLSLQDYNSSKKSCEEELKPLLSGIARIEENSKQKQEDINRVDLNIKKLSNKRDQLIESAEEADEKLEEMQSSWSDALAAHRNLSEELEEIMSSRGSLEDEYDNFQNQLKTLEIAKASSAEKLSSLQLALSEAQKNSIYISAQKTNLHEQIREKEHSELRLNETERQNIKKLELLTQEISAIGEQLKTLNHDCESLNQQKRGEELSMATLKSNIDKQQSETHQSELSINNLNNDLFYLCERIQERHRLKLNEQICDWHDKALDERVAKKRFDELKRSVEKIGSVNENAADEYREFKARQDFLVAQISDLEGALNQLESAINKINKATKIRFLEAFNGINKQFSRVFPRLFNGGKAELVLTNPDDLLTAGVDIMAKPPGKNIGSIELMSGGEKALTAISLIMAIFLIKPSPFCLLDEVDAPLDEANVSRFSQLIREMSSRSQFIVITHNRKTMESADQLYGVTMEDAGASKIVSVAVQQAFETLKQSPQKAAPKTKPTQLLMDDLV
jgi:chromosome segregation protein